VEQIQYRRIKKLGNRFYLLLPAPYNPITRALDHRICYSAFTLPCSPEISSDPDDFLFWRFLRVKIADLPCSPVIHLRAIQKSNQNIGMIEMGFTTGKNLEFGLMTNMCKAIAVESPFAIHA
jgi:hypothetical protein